MSDITAPSQPWYRSLNRSQWNTLIASQLGWLFDGYETYALIISVGVALRQLLDPSQYSQIPVYVGTVIALTLLGWGIGGLMGGVIADYIGRKRTMMLAILGYSLMTGLSAFAWDWMSFAVLRFLVGVTIGSEWVTGASIVSELWPDKNRGKGVGLMQCGRVNERRVAAHERKRSGATLSGQEEALTRFTMADLFAEPEIRRRVILTFLMSLASTFAFWGISTWMPPYMAATAAKAGLPPQQWASYVAMATNGAAIFGYAGLGFLADVYGRKPVTIAYFALAFLSVPIFFLWTHDLTLMLLAGAFSGIFVSGQFTWMACWLPELFPTRIRATATAFVFNIPRLISWTGPLISGWLITSFGGYSHAAVMIATVYILGLAAAPFLPETRGKPLPE
jgi:MFS family permease